MVGVGGVVGVAVAVMVGVVGGAAVVVAVGVAVGVAVVVAVVVAVGGGVAVVVAVAVGGGVVVNRRQQHALDLVRDAAAEHTPVNAGQKWREAARERMKDWPA